MGYYVWATPRISVLGRIFEQSVQMLFLGRDFIGMCSNKANLLLGFPGVL